MGSSLSFAGASCQLGCRARAAWLRELHALCSLPQEDVDAFFESHQVMGQERITSREDEERVVDWYRVLNHFCALGDVEKMYIAPVLDASVGNAENQLLFERAMARSLRAGPDMTLLDLGCGKGRIAHEVATFSGCRVVGLNLDSSQIESAREFARGSGLLGHQLGFLCGSFNDRLPFDDEAFDGAYEVGAFCYAIDKVDLFAEIYRVLKPGGRFSYCDWCRLSYDPEDQHHRELLSQVKPLTGMVEMPFPCEVVAAFEQAGFEVELNREASTCGEPLTSVVRSTKRSFWLAERLVYAADWIGAAPSVKRMWERIREGGQALEEAVELRLFSMTWQIIARRPSGPAPARPARASPAGPAPPAGTVPGWWL